MRSGVSTFFPAIRMASWRKRGGLTWTFIAISPIGFSPREPRSDSASKPRVAAQRLPWVTGAIWSQPSRGCANGPGRMHNPFGVEENGRANPRVAASPQPWALVFGVPCGTQVSRPPPSRRLHAVEREIEDVKIPEARVGGKIGFAVRDQRHFLLGDAAVGAQGLLQLREIVARGAGADHLMLGRDHDDVAHAILGQLEAVAGFGA